MCQLQISSFYLFYYFCLLVFIYHHHCRHCRHTHFCYCLFWLMGYVHLLTHSRLSFHLTDLSYRINTVTETCDTIDIDRRDDNYSEFRKGLVVQVAPGQILDKNNVAKSWSGTVSGVWKTDSLVEPVVQLHWNLWILNVNFWLQCDLFSSMEMAKLRFFLLDFLIFFFLHWFVLRSINSFQILSNQESEQGLMTCRISLTRVHLATISVWLGVARFADFAQFAYRPL